MELAVQQNDFITFGNQVKWYQLYSVDDFCPHILVFKVCRLKLLEIGILEVHNMVICSERSQHSLYLVRRSHHSVGFVSIYTKIWKVNYSDISSSLTCQTPFTSHTCHPVLPELQEYVAGVQAFACGVGVLKTVAASARIDIMNFIICWVNCNIEWWAKGRVWSSSWSLGLLDLMFWSWGELVLVLTG